MSTPGTTNKTAADNSRSHSGKARGIDEVLEQALGVEALIDKTLQIEVFDSNYDAIQRKGLDRTPMSVESRPSLIDHSFATTTCSTPGSVGANRSAWSDDISNLWVKVHRAWDLVDLLGGTNPYAVLDWDYFGRKQTQVKYNTTSPIFGDQLSFKIGLKPEIASPTRSGSLYSPNAKTMLFVTEDDDFVAALPRLTIALYSRHESITDEFLGQVIISGSELQDLLATGEKMIFVIFCDYNSSGFIEISLSS